VKCVHIYFDGKIENLSLFSANSQNGCYLPIRIPPLGSNPAIVVTNDLRSHNSKSEIQLGSEDLEIESHVMKKVRTLFCP
jgi:hypothetical protein